MSPGSLLVRAAVAAALCAAASGAPAEAATSPTCGRVVTRLSELEREFAPAFDAGIIAYIAGEQERAPRYLTRARALLLEFIALVESGADLCAGTPPKSMARIARRQVELIERVSVAGRSPQSVPDEGTLDVGCELGLALVDEYGDAGRKLFMEGVKSLAASLAVMARVRGDRPIPRGEQADAAGRLLADAEQKFLNAARLAARARRSCPAEREFAARAWVLHRAAADTIDGILDDHWIRPLQPKLSR